MDHAYIDDENLVERYLLGDLESEERQRFEEHYLDCERCLERLETARRLRDGLRLFAARETALAANDSEAPRRAAPGPWRRALPAAAVVVLAIALVFVRGAGERAEDALVRANRAEAQASDLARELEDATAPRAVPEAVSLVATRSAEGTAMVLRPGAFGEDLVLEVELGPREAAAPGELRWRFGDEVLWRGDAATAGETLRLAARTESLEPGLHAIELVDAAGEVTRRWPFEVR